MGKLVLFSLVVFMAGIASIQSRPTPVKRQVKSNSSNFTDLQFLQVAVLMTINVSSLLNCTYASILHNGVIAAGCKSVCAKNLNL